MELTSAQRKLVFAGVVVVLAALGAFLIIPNTLELAELWVSAPLIEEAKKHPHLEVTGELQAMPFDVVGNLVQETMFPHSVRGRRGGGRP